MKITARGQEWGTLTATEDSQTVLFCAEGKLVHNAVWRVWGWSEGKEPLLIGVPEPYGEYMQLKRRLTKAFLKNCGYWPKLPEKYMAGESFYPYRQNQAAADSWMREGVQESSTEEYRCLSWPYAPDRPFLYSELFALCSVSGKTASLWLDKKTGQPVWGCPEKEQQ